MTIVPKPSSSTCVAAMSSGLKFGNTQSSESSGVATKPSRLTFIPRVTVRMIRSSGRTMPEGRDSPRLVARPVCYRIIGLSRQTIVR